MKYTLIGNITPAVEISLNKGEAIVSQAGGMTWMSNNISMKTNTNGGILKGLSKMFAGESIFMNTYTAEADEQMIAFAASVSGKILPVDIGALNGGLTVQKGAFLCSEPSVDQSIVLNKKFSSSLFGGEGFILQSLTGSGTAFLEIDGDMVEKELKAGEVLKVDTGNVVAFEKTVAYEIETVKGLSNIVLGGEGLFLTKLTGPGKVVLQTCNFMDFASRIVSILPRSSSN